jgi:hypothetical protein
MLWETKSMELPRCRLTDRFTFKTPRILEFNGLDAEWKQLGIPLQNHLSLGWSELGSSFSGKTGWSTMRNFGLIRESQKGPQKVSGVGLAPDS